MQAIILAAGMGKRLGEYTQDNTKCMLVVNGVRLIDRTLESLYSVGVSRVVLVVGYKGQNVKDYVGYEYKGIPIEYVENPIYDKTNNIYSLFLAKEYLMSEDTLLLESDSIFDSSVVQKLVDDPNPNLALVDKYESWMDGTVVTLDDERRILRIIDKEHFRYEEIKDYYKTVNIYKFSKEFSAKYYVPFLAAYSSALGNNEYYEQVLRVILHLRNAPLKALPLNGEPWYEIDDVQDLDIASGLFAPTDDERYAAISSRYGGYWRYPQMKDYCYLVNPYFPPQRMIEEIKASFEDLMRGYPSGMRVNSLLASKNFNVRQEYIVVGNGAAELIKVLMENWTERLGNIVPTFEEYPNRLDADKVIQFIPRTEDFNYTADDLMSFYDDKDIDALFSGIVQHTQELIGLAVLIVAFIIGTLGYHRVELIEEDKRGSFPLCLTEHLPNLLLCAMHEGRSQVIRHNLHEVDAHFLGNLLGKEGLAASCRAVEQQTWRCNAECLGTFLVIQYIDETLSHHLLQFVHTSHVTKPIAMLWVRFLYLCMYHGSFRSLLLLFISILASSQLADPFLFCVCLDIHIYLLVYLFMVREWRK